MTEEVKANVNLLKAMSVEELEAEKEKQVEKGEPKRVELIIAEINRRK